MKKKNHTWNHRILAHWQASNFLEDGGYWYFGIHEVHYDNDKPGSYTADAISIISEEGLDGIKWTLDKMLICLNKPILNAEDWPNEFDYENWLKKEKEKGE